MKQAPSLSFVLFSAVITFIVTVMACAKSNREGSAGTTAQPNPAITALNIRQTKDPVRNLGIAAEATPVNSRDDRPGASFQLQNVKPEALAKSNSISNPYNSQFFPIKPYERLVPVDFKIGELLDFQGLSREERLVVTTLTGFMESLEKGEIKKDAIDENEYLKVFRLVSPSLANAVPVDYRVGRIKMTSRDDASVALRVYGEKGSACGSIYFKKKESAWLVTDVQIDLSDYEPQDGTEKFMPSAYNNWMY